MTYGCAYYTSRKFNCQVISIVVAKSPCALDPTWKGRAIRKSYPGSLLQPGSSNSRNGSLYLAMKIRCYSGLHQSYIVLEQLPGPGSPLVLIIPWRLLGN